MTFFVGQSSLIDGGIVENAGQKGGIASWGVAFEEAGKYRLTFKYTSTTLRGTTIHIDSDSIGRSFFMKNTNAYQTFDVGIDQPGCHTLQLKATGVNRLPAITAFRIFPPQGQALPSHNQLTGISDRQKRPRRWNGGCL